VEPPKDYNHFMEEQKMQIDSDAPNVFKPTPITKVYYLLLPASFAHFFID